MHADGQTRTKIDELEEYSHNGNMYVPRSGLTNLHLSGSESATPRFGPGGRLPSSSPTSSSSVVGIGVYSPVGGERNGEESGMDRKEWDEGRRKKYVAGMMTGRI